MPGVDDNQNTNIFGHIDDNKAVYVPQAGLADARAIAVNVDDDSPFYEPWTGPGMRLELKAIPGVTRKGLLNIPFRFQVPPLDEFRIDMSVMANDYTTIQDGTYTRMGGVELVSVTFDTLVTFAPAPWVIAKGMWDINKVAHRLRDIHNSRTPFRLVAWHPGPVVELNMPATFRSLGRAERAGEPDARYLTPSFTQWRDPIQQRRDKKHWPRQHKLRANDTLASIARDNYGKPSEGRYIGLSNDHLHHWGVNTEIVKNKHYRAGDNIKVPAPSQSGVSQRRAV
jgi:hypothetical protein